MPTNKPLPTIYAWTKCLPIKPKSLSANADFERRLCKREQQCQHLASAFGVDIGGVRDLMRRGTYVKEYVTNAPFSSETHAEDHMAEFAMSERDPNPPSLTTIRQWANEFGHSDKKKDKRA